jgi:hypothetical protein
MDDSFGVFADGQDHPAAVFVDLEEAIAWGLLRFGADRFGIRHCPVTLLGPDEERACLAAS